tara:strand:- start:146 stop:409 length:264 start_codon:yes stop_codon:yes gene_type:complete
MIASTMFLFGMNPSLAETIPVGTTVSSGATDPFNGALSETEREIDCSSSQIVGGSSEDSRIQQLCINAIIDTNTTQTSNISSNDTDI